MLICFSTWIVFGFVGEYLACSWVLPSQATIAVISNVSYFGSFKQLAFQALDCLIFPGIIAHKMKKRSYLSYMIRRYLAYKKKRICEQAPLLWDTRWGRSNFKGLFISLCLTTVKRTSIQTSPSYDNLSFNAILHTWSVKWDANTMKMVNRLAGWMPDPVIKDQFKFSLGILYPSLLQYIYNAYNIVISRLQQNNTTNTTCFKFIVTDNASLLPFMSCLVTFLL